MVEQVLAREDDQTHVPELDVHVSFTATTSDGIILRLLRCADKTPGTGKTSFAMALASQFAVDIYVVSLLDHSLTDAGLIGLFNQLPSRCLLLLEDIDTAGLNRKSRPRTRSRAGPFRSNLEDGDSDEEDGNEGGKTKSTVTLSGLLNAIDGVAAPEG